MIKFFLEWMSEINGFTVLSVILCIATYLSLSRKIRKLENNHVIQNEFIVNSRVKFLADQHNISRLFRMVEPNADNIKSLQAQVRQLNELLGTVMGASDLIPRGFDTPEDRVEEIRQRVKWEKERRNLSQVDESDFYQG